MELLACSMDSNEWVQLKCIKNFLNSFENTIRALSGTYYLTIHHALYYLTKISEVFIESRNDPILVNINAPIEAKINRGKEYS